MGKEKFLKFDIKGLKITIFQFDIIYYIGMAKNLSNLTFSVIFFIEKLSFLIFINSSYQIG